MYILSWYHQGQLCLAVHPWLGEMSTGDCHSHCWGRNGEFWV